MWSPPLQNAGVGIHLQLSNARATPIDGSLNRYAVMIEATIRQQEARLRAAQLQSDVVALDQLIDDALLFTGPDGALSTKADDLALHRAGAITFLAHEPSDLHVRVITSDVVVVVLRTHLVGRFHGADFAGDYQYTRVWARHADVWRIVAGHVSALAPET